MVEFKLHRALLFSLHHEMRRTGRNNDYATLVHSAEQGGVLHPTSCHLQFERTSIKLHAFIRFFSFFFSSLSDALC